MPLNLSDHQIQRLIAGKTVSVRVKKKEGERILFEKEIVTGSNTLIDIENHFRNTVAKAFGFPVILTKNGRVKFQVGKDYAVHRKAMPIWFCNKCKWYDHNWLEKIVGKIEKLEFVGTALKGTAQMNCCYTGMHRLRTRITEITQEEDMKPVYKDWEYDGKVWCLKCEVVK